MTWNALIGVKCNGSINNTQWDAIKSESWVKNIWSAMGEWDFWIVLDESVQQQDQLENTVLNLRQQPWINDTQTSWIKEV